MNDPVRKNITRFIDLRQIISSQLSENFCSSTRNLVKSAYNVQVHYYIERLYFKTYSSSYAHIRDRPRKCRDYMAM